MNCNAKLYYTLLTDHDKRLPAQLSILKKLTTFCGYGAYTDNFENPPIEWNLNHTYIQDKGINQNFGLFDTPDEFYEKHQQKLGAFKRFVYRKIVRHRMNKNVEKIRNGK